MKTLVGAFNPSRGLLCDYEISGGSFEAVVCSLGCTSAVVATPPSLQPPDTVQPGWDVQCVTRGHWSQQPPVGLQCQVEVCSLEAFYIYHVLPNMYVDILMVCPSGDQIVRLGHKFKFFIKTIL